MKINNYEEFIKLLYSYQDLNYKSFHGKLILSDNLIGVRAPILKRIAKDISKSDYDLFLKLNKHNLYEENMLHGFLLGYLNEDFHKIKEYIDIFLNYIDNWAVCDMTAANLKIFKKYKDEGFVEIKKYIFKKNPWINRFGYVLMLSYYIEDNYIDEIFSLCNKYQNEYYVKMSIAWLLSICYINYKKKTLNFLSNSNLDKWTYNKTIQKIIESTKTNEDEKTILKGMKIK